MEVHVTIRGKLKDAMATNDCEKLLTQKLILTDMNRQVMNYDRLKELKAKARCAANSNSPGLVTADDYESSSSSSAFLSTLDGL